MNIGYARISTGDQTLELQLEASAKADCGRIFTETASGDPSPPARTTARSGARSPRPQGYLQHIQDIQNICLATANPLNLLNLLRVPFKTG